MHRLAIETPEGAVSIVAMNHRFSKYLKNIGASMFPSNFVHL